MKELFQKLSANSHSFKENRLAYQEEGGVETKESDEAAFEALLEEEEKAEKKPKKPLAEYGARAKEWKEEKEEYEEEKEAEKKEVEEEAKVNSAIEYANKLMEKDISRFLRIEFSLELDPETEEKMNRGETAKGLFAKAIKDLRHECNFRIYGDSELTDEEVMDLKAEVDDALREISAYQEAAYEKAVESPEWQKIKNYKVFRKKARKFFEKLNEPLNRLPAKVERKNFFVLLAAFKAHGADEYAKKFVSETYDELLKKPRRPKKGVRKVITKYKEFIPVRVAADVEEEY